MSGQETPEGGMTDQPFGFKVTKPGSDTLLPARSRRRADPVNEMITWLRAQLDTDERLARSVEPVPRQRWEAVSGEWGPQVRTERGSEPHWSHEIQAEVWRCDDEMDGCPDVARTAMAEAEFIAANDPDRALRQIQAHRAILDEAEYWGTKCETDPTYPAVADRFDAIMAAVRALVSIYSDRDGYNSDWSA